MIHRLFIVSHFFVHAIITVSQVSTVEAFFAIHHGTSSNLLSQPKSTIKANIGKPFWVSRLDEDSGQSLESPPVTECHEQNRDEARWKNFKEINNKFWDYTCNFFYVGISCLILLNFCGFGYTISAEEGLNVMPLNTYRQQRQWQQEIQRLQTQPIPNKPLSLIQQGHEDTIRNNART